MNVRKATIVDVDRLVEIRREFQLDVKGTQGGERFSPGSGGIPGRSSGRRYCRSMDCGRGRTDSLLCNAFLR